MSCSCLSVSIMLEGGANNLHSFTPYLNQVCFGAESTICF